MDKTWINVLERPKLKNPILIEGLPGIGNVGRTAAGYIVSKMKAKKFAELYSPHFLPLIIVEDKSVGRLLRAEFYYIKSKPNDLIILIGDYQSTTSEGYYEISGEIINFAKKLGVKEIITLGGLGTGKIQESSEVYGVVNDEKLLKKFRKYNIKFVDRMPETIIGISGILIGLAKVNGIDAISLLAETSGLPFIIADPIAADAMLRVLSKILNIKIDLSDLEKEVEELEEKIKKSEELQKKIIHELSQEKKELEYIG